LSESERTHARDVSLARLNNRGKNINAKNTIMSVIDAGMQLFDMCAKPAKAAPTKSAGLTFERTVQVRPGFVSVAVG